MDASTTPWTPWIVIEPWDANKWPTLVGKTDFEAIAVLHAPHASLFIGDDGYTYPPEYVEDICCTVASSNDEHPEAWGAIDTWSFFGPEDHPNGGVAVVMGC
jgi:hypothetical protein